MAKKFGFAQDLRESPHFVIAMRIEILYVIASPCDSKAKQSAGFANEVKQPSKSRESKR